MTHVEIFLPCFNTGKKSLETINTVASALKKFDVTYNVIAVDDGSSDNTSEYLDLAMKSHAANLKIIRNKNNLGIGASIKPVILNSRSNFFMFLPGDNDVPYDAILKLLNSIDKTDMAVLYLVNREIRGHARNILSNLYNFILMTFSRCYLLYATGPGIYKTELIQATIPRSNRFGVIAEINIHAYFKSNKVGQGSLCVSNGIAGSSLIRPSAIMEALISLLWLLFSINYLRLKKKTTDPELLDIN